MLSSLWGRRRYSRRNFAPEQDVERRQNQQRQNGRRNNATDHHGGKWPLKLSARACRDSHRYKPEGSHHGGHQHGTKTRECPLCYGFEQRFALFAQAFDEGDDDEAIQILSADRNLDNGVNSFALRP